MVEVRVAKAFVGGIQFLQVCGGMLSYFVKGGPLVDDFSVMEYGHEEFSLSEVFRIGFGDMGKHGVVCLDRAFLGNSLII